MFTSQYFEITPTPIVDFYGESIYETDEFRMYSFKVKLCPRTRSHDWTLCPFAHRGEKARRRDPRKYDYAPVSCPDFKNGECSKGDFCHFAHGVFEFWLHPAKYRTRPCNAAGSCRRRVCFFAHTPEELRGDGQCEWLYTFNVQNAFASDGGCGCGGVVAPPPSPPLLRPDHDADEFLKKLNFLSLGDNGEKGLGRVGLNVPDIDYPDVEWISDLVE